MSEPFLGEIRIFAGNFAPTGWALCEGQLLAISQNDALFSLLGTIYGGDGRTTFGLPDLRGRVPIHMGSGPGLTPRNIGSNSGAEEVTLTQANLPVHRHPMRASSASATTRQPAGNVLATALGGVYFPNADPTSMDPANTTGGSTGHNNVMPSLVINFIIALHGIYPSRT